MSLLVVIPARGGSKSVPRKNIALVAGRPLIAYTVEAALAAACVDRVVVSTDDLEIADVARRLGAEVPFLRPANLALDGTPGTASIVHAAEWLERECDYHPEFVACLQPTSPLRAAFDIDAALTLAIDKQAAAVISVVPATQHPLWMRQVDAHGHLQSYLQVEEPARRQELPPVYVVNGAIYIIRRDLLLTGGTWETDQTFAYVMPPERSLDVDTAWDLGLADLILRARLNDALG